MVAGMLQLSTLFSPVCLSMHLLRNLSKTGNHSLVALFFSSIWLDSDGHQEPLKPIQY